MGAAPRLSAVVVHWGDPGPLAGLAAAWPDDPRFELLVVDNGGPAGEGTDAAGAWAAVERRGRVLRPGTNLGFGGGADAGIAAARGDLLLILNPDARPAPGALEALLAGFDAHPEAAGLAPKLLGDDGEPQYAWQLRRLPSAGQLLAQAAGLPLAPEARREPAAGEAVEQPAAAALALTRDAYRRAGGFDPGFQPAWFEDVDLAARFHRLGLPLLYHPDAVFHHSQGATVGQLGYGRFLWIYQRNLVRYLGKHHGGLTALAARLLLPLGLALRFAALPLRKPHRAATRRQAARGLANALTGALTSWRRPKKWTPQTPENKAPTQVPGTWERAHVSKPSAEVPVTSSRAYMSNAEAVSQDLAAVAVCIVTRDSAPDVADCFAAVAALTHRPLSVVVVDCASSDGTVAEVERHRGVLAAAGVPLTVVPLDDNLGFAGGMNAALDAADAPWVLSLNADAWPAPDYVDRLLARAAAHPNLSVGAVTGRLLRLAGADSNGDGRRLDACGMRLTRTWRHLDRGSGERDDGRYDHPARVFGATGAASLFRRAALDDAALDGDPFDPLFHSFREDAELAFRLRERGWEVLYEPAAVADHRRFNLPERRSAMPAAVNYHSLKNRYLLRLYHQTGRNLLRTLLPTLARDAAALGYVLLRERSSLAAYAWLWRNRRRLLDRRRRVQARRLLPAADLDRWFGREEMPL